MYKEFKIGNARIFVPEGEAFKMENLTMKQQEDIVKELFESDSMSCSYYISKEELEAQKGLIAISKFYELLMCYGDTPALREGIYKSKDKLLIAEYKDFKKKKR